MTATVRQTAPRPATPGLFELKSESSSLIVLRLRHDDLSRVNEELEAKLARTPGFFAKEPVLLDLTPLDTAPAAQSLDELIQTLKRHQLIPLAARIGNELQQPCIEACGLTLLPRSSNERKAAPLAAEPVTPAAAPSEEAPAIARSRIVEKPIRTGQQSYAAAGDLVVLGMVSAGAEVIADGCIHVYGPLRGRALAGVKGDIGARIFAHSLEAELVSIAGIYRTFEQDWGAEFRGKAVQIFLDGDKLMIAALTPT